MTTDRADTHSIADHPTVIPAQLGILASKVPGSAALVAPGRSKLSFSRLMELVAGQAAGLQGRSAGHRPRTALVFPDGPELAVAFLAAMSAGAAAPLHPRYTEAEFRGQLVNLKADLLVVDARLEPTARQAAEAAGVPVIVARPQLGEPAGAFEFDGSAPATGSLAMPGPDDVALLLHTSGTTAKPKVVPLTQANLAASASNIRRWLRLKPDDRCLNVMPLFHIHGIMAALLASLTAGASLACTPAFVAPEFFRWMDELEPTWYTAVPTMHQSILARVRQEGARPAGRLRFLRSSSAPLPPSVLSDLESLFEAPMIEAYGMTEASHQMASNPLPPGQRKPGSVGLPSGTEMAVMDEAGQVLPRGATGEIVIRGPNVMKGYEANLEANERAFADGWFRTGDQGFFDDDGRLFISGRLKELINRGGEKIAPREIDEALLSHPAVDQALAFAIPDRRLGEEIGAVVVLKPGESASEADLLGHVSERLADFKLPRRIMFLEQIPKGPTGKPQRIGLAERLGIYDDSPKGSGRSPGFKAPKTLVQETLAGIWGKVLNLERVGIHDRFLDLGGDSITAIMVLTRVRETFDLDLSVVDFFEAETVAEQADIIERRLGRGVG